MARLNSLNSQHWRHPAFGETGSRVFLSPLTERVLDIDPAMSLPLGRLRVRFGDKIVFNHGVEAVFFYTIPDGLEDDAQPAVHGFQVQPVQDGGDFVPLQRLFHQVAQFILLLGE